MTHPGVGPVTALATEVFLGDPQRFADGKALASYVGSIPREYSSGGHQRLGGVTKQGSPLLRFLWGEAGAHAARHDPELNFFFQAEDGLRGADVNGVQTCALPICSRMRLTYSGSCARREMSPRRLPSES